MGKHGLGACCLHPCLPAWRGLASVQRDHACVACMRRALCWCERAVGEGDMAALVAGAQELTVMQDTPVRVLHRRAPKVRPRK